MNSSNPLQIEESGIGNDIYNATSALSLNAKHQVQRVLLFTVDRTAKPVTNATQTLEDQQFDDQDSQELFLQCLHLSGTETYVFLLGNRKSIELKPIYPLYRQQFNILRLFFKAKMMKALTMNPQMRKMNIHVFRTLQRPPSSQKIFLERSFTVQLSTEHLK